MLLDVETTADEQEASDDGELSAPEGLDEDEEEELRSARVQVEREDEQVTPNKRRRREKPYVSFSSRSRKLLPASILLLDLSRGPLSSVSFIQLTVPPSLCSGFFDPYCVSAFQVVDGVSAARTLVMDADGVERDAVVFALQEGEVCFSSFLLSRSPSLTLKPCRTSSFTALSVSLLSSAPSRRLALPSPPLLLTVARSPYLPSPRTRSIPSSRPPPTLSLPSRRSLVHRIVKTILPPSCSPAGQPSTSPVGLCKRDVASTRSRQSVGWENMVFGAVHSPSHLSCIRCRSLPREASARFSV
jgi:hypothetical protein